MEPTMKTKLKAFTLIELIVVMAILIIMMAAIMKFFEPIRQVYNDATFYEQRRSVTNAMCKYTTESIRYAKYLGIYPKSEVGGSGPKDSARAAASRLQTSLMAIDSTLRIPNGAEVNVIELDYSQSYPATLYNNKQYLGRLFRTKGTWSVSGTGSGNLSTLANTHLAFGTAYYSSNNYNMQWAYQGGKFEAYASSYNADDGLNPDGIVVRSVTATILKNLDINNPGKVCFTDTNSNDVPDFTESSLTTTGTNIPYGGMNVSQNYYLVWVNAGQMQ
jgi:type II secretory pathway pseudopilin PulG